MDEIAELREEIAKLKAENQRTWDLVKTYFAQKSKNMPSIPKVKLNKKTWILIIAWQILGGIFKWLPEEMFF